MLNYTYFFDIQGHGASHYVKIVVDRQLSEKYVSRTGRLREASEPLAVKIMDRLAQIKGVISTSNAHCNESELIKIDGNEIALKVSAVTVPDKRRVTQAAIKRIQRVIAPNEPRKCIGLSKLMAQVAAVNAKLA